jgi:O-antigen ligase
MIFYYSLLLMARFHSDPRFGAPLFYVGPVLATPVKFVGLFAVLVAMLSAPPAGRAPRIPNLLGILFLTFAILPLLIAFSFGWQISTDPISSLLSFGLLFVSTRLLITTEERLLKSVRVIVIASTLGSLWLYKQHFLMHISRPGGIEGDCNYEALTLVMDLPLAVWMVIHEHASHWRRIGYVSAIVNGVGIILTQSRAGLIALAVAGLTTVLYSRRKLFATLMVCAAVLLIVTFAPSSLFERFQNTSLNGAVLNGDEQSSRIHFELVKAGLTMIAAHPIFGVGLDRFKAVAPAYNPNLLQIARRSYIAHNTYVQIAAECGLPVFVIFLAMMATAMRNYGATRKLDRGAVSDLAFAMQVGLIGFCVAGASVTAGYVTTFWIFVFLSQNLREIGVGDASRASATARKEISRIAHRAMLGEPMIQIARTPAHEG